MTKQYYECHVTMEGNPSRIKPLVEALKWKFSCIDGDPILGNGLKCYATRHFNIKLSEDQVRSALHQTASILALEGVEVVRRKVERVIYDDRIDKPECSGGCPECHLDDLLERAST